MPIFVFLHDFALVSSFVLANRVVFLAWQPRRRRERERNSTSFSSRFFLEMIKRSFYFILSWACVFVFTNSCACVVYTRRDLWRGVAYTNYCHLRDRQRQLIHQTDCSLLVVIRKIVLLYISANWVTIDREWDWERERKRVSVLSCVCGIHQMQLQDKLKLFLLAHQSHNFSPRAYCIKDSSVEYLRQQQQKNIYIYV